MNMPDDCYELEAFRRFRDTYMSENKERQEFVDEYYQVAPIIVTAIDLTPGSKEKYNHIWKQYLLPCLKDLENNHLFECQERYKSMMSDLKKNYICW